MKKALFLLPFLLLTVGCKLPYPPVNFLERQVTVGGVTYAYRVYRPKVRPPGQKLPVMLYLHGSGSNGDDNVLQLKDLKKIVGQNPQNFPFIVVAPQARAGTFWNTEMIAQAMAALDRSIKEFDGDEKRVYLVGWSMGALGAWHTAVLYPGKFAALAPISGRIMPNPREREILAPELLKLVDAPEPFSAFAGQLKDIPIWIFHGAEDEELTVEGSRRMNRALLEAGNPNVHYTEYPGIGHYAIAAALSEPTLFEWLAKQRIK